MIIKKENIKGLLKEAAKDWDVYAPQRNLGGDIWFDVVSKDNPSLDNLVLDDVDTVISVKDVFFPQLETMFEFSDGRIKETPESSPKLIFGIRPCDLKGMLFADEFYKRNLEDKYYLNRIQNRLIVVKGCLKPPRPTCFCTSAKTGPFADGGYDLQLVETSDSYFVEVGSKRGEDFIKKYSKFFKDSLAKAEEAILEIKKKAIDSLELKIDFQKALNLMADDKFVPEENYKRIAERCIYCGGCLYVCPTCTCFNVFDNVKNSEGLPADGSVAGERLRNWDGCVFEGYTRETSGHNPRKEKGERTARRYEHKLKFDYKSTGMSGCVACGRCLSSCPVDIGISKFIQEITENKKTM